MASRIEKGQYFILSYLSGTSPDEWTPVACLTQKTFDSAVAATSVTSDCGPSSIGGTTTQTFNAQGFVDFDSSDSISGPGLYDLQIADQNGLDPAYSWKIEPASPVTGDQSLTFNALINHYNESWQTDQPTSFTCDFTIQGIAAQSIT